MADEIKFTLKVDDKGTATIKKFASSADKLDDKVDKTTRAFKKQRGAIDKSSAALKSFAKVGFAGVIAGSALMGKSIIKAGADFQQSMLTVKGVMRATDKEFTALQASAREMGATTEWSATQAANALQFLGMAGFDAEKAMTALPGVLDLATAGQIELARAADIASNAMSAMGMGAEELGRINDVFIATITRTNTNIDMMGESFKYAAPKAKAYGYDVEELSSMIGLLGNAGIQGSMAGTQLAFAMGKVSKVFKDAGMDGTGKKLVDALQLINDQGYDTDKVMKMFGERGGRAVLVLKNLVPELKNMEDTLRGAEGEARKLADTMRSSLHNQFKVLLSTIQDQALDIFDDYAVEISDVIAGTIEWVRVMGPIFRDTIGAAVEVVKTLAHWFDVIGTGLGIAAAKVVDFVESIPIVDFGDMITFDDELEEDTKSAKVEMDKLLKGTKTDADKATKAVEDLDEVVKKVAKVKPTPAAKKAEKVKGEGELAPLALDEFALEGATKWIREFNQKRLAQEREKAKELERITAEEVEAEIALKTMLFDSVVSKDQDYFTFKKTMLDNEKAKYEEIFGETALINEAFAQRYIQLEREKLLESQNFFDGIRVGIAELRDEQKTWAEEGKEFFEDFAGQSKDTVQSLLFDGMKGDLDDFGSYWESFWDGILTSLTTKISDKLTDMALDMAFAMFGYQKGAWEIKKDHIAVVHKGEMIIPEGPASDIRKGPGRSAATGISNNISSDYNISLPITVAEGGERVGTRIQTEVQDLVIKIMKEEMR